MNLHPTAERLKKKLAQAEKLDSKTFDTFYKLFGCPDDLRGFAYVLYNLAELVQITRDIPGIGVDHKKLDILQTTATMVLNGKKPEDEEVRQFFFNYPKMLERNFEGLKRSAFVYSALGHRPYIETEWPRYSKLLSQLLTCYFQEEDSKTTVGDTTIEEACVAIREFSYRENTETLRQLPNEGLSTEEYLNRLEAIRPPKGKINSYPELLRFLRRALGQRKAAESTEKTNGRDPGILNPEEQRRHRDEGGTPSEFKNSTSQQKGSSRQGRKSTRSEQQKSRQKARGKRNAIARRNQHLSFDKAELSINDFAILMDALNSDDPCGLSTLQIQYESKAILSVMIWTGKSLKEALRFNVHKKEPKLLGKGQAALIWSNSAKNWLLSSPGPNIKEPSQEQEFLFYPTTDRISLPLLPSTESVISNYLHHRKINNRTSVPLFTMKYNAARQHTQRLLTHLKKNNFCEATLVNINTFLEKQMNRMDEGESAKTALSLGIILDIDDDYNYAEGEEFQTSEDERRSPVKMHYQSSPENSLRDNYIYSTRHLESLWLGEPLPAAHGVESQTNDHSLHLGTPLRPREACVRDLVGKLKMKVIESQPEHLDRDDDDIVNYHNAYTAYTALMNNVCSVLRAIKNPAIPSEHMDVLTGFAVISDKDDDDSYNSRRIWMPSLVLEQNTHFAHHMHALYNAIHTLSPSFPEFFKQSPPATGTSYILLDDEFNAYFMRPIDLRNYIKNNFSIELPGNWQRHYMRPLLLAARCPQETINALMGHFETGQEPWARTSAFHPADFLSTLSTPLESIMIQDGWEAMSGLEIGL